ncbi:hypothetical protein NOR_05091 [Metarhizium rileyi]|uniref:Phospholipid metabolism enzyme regulator n=1 Tax=Metarhizium rileyi (strain RCEF 4871) TaxID=1649241 RepID=A0A167DDG9_METRR|nr:hypothetical protein NOR_05091 [Metarhizium rileyi RCEF 4871]TWU72407.1 hypothetical protein ED733_001964 [Metarhizium rileyi]
MDKSSTVAADVDAGTATTSTALSSTKTNNTTGPNGPSLPPPNSSTTGSQTSKQSSAANSVVQSPAASRDGSPSRQPRGATSSTWQSGSRFRKNSHQELSPTRQVRQGNNQDQGTPTRKLSSVNTPNLRPHNRDLPIYAPTPQKPSAIPDLKDNPRWPISPRLRSPPPQLGRPGATTPTRPRSEQETPAIIVPRQSPSPLISETQVSVLDSDTDDSQAPSGVRTPVRGLLETVQEVSHNNSPARPSDSAMLDQVKEKLGVPDNHSEHALSDGGRTLKPKMSAVSEQYGADSIIRPDLRRPSSVPPPPMISRQSSAMSAKQNKSKPETGFTQSMTVETETVSSIPQVALTTATKEGGNGTLKAKPSTETIKPKKDKKRTARKQPAVGAGTASSKADNFEAKIASAVDEANTSDSEETFVYDSNPPDNTERTNRRFHSRTPSATSMASQADRQNLRSIYGVMEGISHGPVAKKSMKFVNTFNGNASDSLTPCDEDGKGSGRSAGGSARGTVRHHHHIGRWGRQPGNGHASLFDNESPFPNAAKAKFPSGNSNNNSRSSSHPSSPRTFLSTRGQLNPKRSAMQMSSSYDLDDTTGADDERTPLIGTTRSLRGGRRRGPHTLRQAESQTYTRRSSYLNRFAACLVLTMMLLLVITGAIGFMFATSQPMTDIEIMSIENVVTSEQILMFDLTVKAHNPNIVVVTIDHANLDIFAKSEYAGTDTDWRKHSGGPGGIHAQDDPINDPPKFPGPGDGDDTDSRPNILLGRITEFDSPLTFEGSLFHQGASSSTGQMQLSSPGNGTSGGSDRWDRIYQNEFDLIVKGVVKYSLPLSAHIRSATVSGRTTVKPNSANDPSHKPNSTILGR